MDNLTRIFHASPYPIRVALASLRGYYLRTWRYGRETERLVEEALERERWNERQWKTWQEDRLSFLLHRAATRVPFYRDQWSLRRKHNDRASWEMLENWPILEKEAVRSNQRSFLAEDCHARRMFRDHTSGTSGTPITVWLSRSTVRAWYALFEARWRRWYGISRFDRWAILGGQLIVPTTRVQPPFWVWNFGLNQLYMSAYHLSSDLVPFYLKALTGSQIEYIWGYSSSLYTLSVAANRLGLHIPLKVAITNAEPLYEFQRDSIERAFQCNARETYGMSEAIAAASECEVRNMHLWPETGITEIHDGNGFVGQGQKGNLVCTGLINTDMPLVRYRLGDVGSISPPGEICSCGRHLPLMGQIEGRIDDVVYAKDGRPIGRLDPVFKADLPIVEAQIIQESLDHFRILVVPARGYSSSTRHAIEKRLRARIGSVDVSFEEVDTIPRSASGKFKAVINRMPKGEPPRSGLSS